MMMYSYISTFTEDIGQILSFSQSTHIPDSKFEEFVLTMSLCFENFTKMLLSVIQLVALPFIREFNTDFKYLLGFPIFQLFQDLEDF